MPRTNRQLSPGSFQPTGFCSSHLCGDYSTFFEVCQGVFEKYFSTQYLMRCLSVLHTEQLQLLLKTCLLIRRLYLESRIRIITYRLAILNSLLASLGLVRRQIHNDTAIAAFCSGEACSIYALWSALCSFLITSESVAFFRHLTTKKAFNR